MDRDWIVDVAPHYVAMLLLVYLALGALRVAVGELGFWVELVIIAAIVFLYRPAVLWLGVGPDAWTE